ncbi:MAG: transglycosylase domain-containing protein [Clostridia bacterium]|nr:transglycosylase domain-containing protein [Clostridia bacterium]
MKRKKTKHEIDEEEDRDVKKYEKKIEKNIKKKNKKNKKSKKKKHKKLKIFLIIIFLLILIAGISGAGVIYAIFKTDKWTVTKEDFLSEAGATVYDSAGNEIAALTGDEINKKVDLEEMGKIPEAFISIEDERFYSHDGIDYKRTAHAILNYVMHKGNSSFGGSTITQQLVKITMKDTDQTWERKIREWSRARQVEEMLTKEQILQRYLNRIYLGSASGLEVRGVEAASNYYFNKSAKDLSIAESAFIAGINHSPNSYNAITLGDEIADKVKSRTKIVVDKMHELGKINDEEYNSSIEEINNGMKFEQGNLSNGKNDLKFHTAAAINQIASELSDKNDISYDEAREQAINSGYKIYTTMNSDIQAKMEAVFADEKYIYTGSRAKNRDEDHKGQSAMVVIEPETGYVVGEVGGLGKDLNTLGINRGLSKRQGGSAFKPLVTIAPALENKVITASTLFYDTKTSFGRYTVSNDSNAYFGIANMRTILTHSCNVPEVKMLSIMGTDKSAEFLGEIGIEVDPDVVGLSMALGTVDVSPLQMAAGYAMLANKGTYISPTFYTKVTDKDDNVVIEPEQEKKQVMSEANAYIETSLLEGPIKSGTASQFNGFLGSMDVSGKTGTTETAGDRWFCGYTPYYAGACWYGNDNNNGEFHNDVCGGRNPAATVWFNSMKKIQEGLETKKFEKPEDVISVRTCKATGKKATGGCSDTYTEIFAKGCVPQECDGHSVVEICKESKKKATEFCPEKEKKTYGYVIDTEKNANWKPRMEHASAPSETCDIHTEAPKESVPPVVGESQSSATKKLKAAGFDVKIEKDNDKKKKKGVVLRQSATEASKGATIVLTVNEYDGGKDSETGKNNTVTNETSGNSGGNKNNTTSTDTTEESETE